MQALTRRKAKSLQKELGDLIYRNPETAQWETADEYLSGNVRQKLKQAEATATLDKSYHANVNALREVQPEDLKPGDISGRFGSPWIPPSDVQQFVVELLDMPEHAVRCSYSYLCSIQPNIKFTMAITRFPRLGRRGYFENEIHRHANRLQDSIQDL